MIKYLKIESTLYSC